MANIIKKFGKWLFNIKDKKEVVQPISPEDMRQNKLINQLQLKNQGYEAELAINQAEKKEIEDKEKKRNIEEELKQKLQEQKLELKSNKLKHIVSLRKMFNTLERNRKLADSIEIMDSEYKKSFGIFGDIAIIDDGKRISLALLDNENPANIITSGLTMKDIISKPASLNNIQKRLAIACTLDENGVKVIDVNDMLVPDLIRDDENKMYVKTKEYEEKITKALAKRDNIINSQREDIEREERLRIELERELRDTKMANSSFKNQVDNMKSDLSQALDVSMQYTTKSADIHRRLTTLQEYQVMHEAMVEGLKNVNEALRKASEEMGKNTEYRKALVMIQELMRNAKELTPRIIHEHHEPEPVKTPQVQPGEIIK